MIRKIQQWNGERRISTYAVETPFPVHARNHQIARKRMRDRMRDLDRRYRPLRIMQMKWYRDRVRKDATVKVGVLAKPIKGKRFILLYGDENHGTGPFRTRHEAIGWFVRGGR